jgi:polysaccharide export outer membrane protein
MRRRLPSLTAATLIALCAAPALGATALPPPDTVSADRTAADYRIGPSDSLDIDVDQLKELSKVVQVSNDGRILLPLIGQIQAAGRTTGELSDDIATALKRKYMKDPQVVVSLKEAQGNRVTVDGAVVQPGVYPLVGPTTLLQAVSLAKGPDPKLADIKKVAIFRTVGGARRTAFYDLAQVRAGKAEDPMVYGNDIVVVNSSGSKAFMQNFQGGFGLLGMLIRPW